MAQATIMDSKLRLKFETGLDGKGQPIYKTKTYGNIRKDVTVNELYQAAQALGRLGAYPLAAVERADNFDIVG